MEITPIFSDNELITRVRNLTRVSSDIVEDVDIDFYFELAESKIEQLSRKKFVATEITEVRDGDGTADMILNNTPIISIESVTIDDILIDESDYVFYAESGKVSLVGSALTEDATAALTFSVDDLQNVIIVYSYGDINEYNAAQSLAFYMVCKKVLWAAGAYEAKGATAEKEKDYSVSYAGGMPYSGLIKGLDQEIEELTQKIGLGKVYFGIF